VEKDNNTTLLIDIAVPRDSRVKKKEQEKVDKYQNLARELNRLWKVNTNIIPVVVGALGTTRKSPEKNLKRAAAAVSSASSYFRKLHSCVGIQISFIKNLDLSIVPLEKYRAMVSHLLGFLIFT